MIVLSNNILTQFVNTFVGGLRFQKVQALKDPLQSAYLIKLESYPKGRLLIAKTSSDEIKLWQKEEGLPKLPSWSNQQVPQAILYLRAHFLNIELMSCERCDAESCLLKFADSRSIEIKFNKNGLDFKFQIPDKKAFLSSLNLAQLPLSNEETPATETSATIPPEDKKKLKLLSKIKEDIEEAHSFLDRYGGILKKFQNDPTLWDSKSRWSLEDQKILEELFQKKLLAPWSPSQRKSALEKSYKLIRRMERKKINGEKRYKEVETSKSLSQKTPNNPKGQAPSENSMPSRPQKKPGLWVCLKNKIWARIGRSATENDELFKQAKDRDLWFHVRSLGGAHVWIPRGQKGFGAKDEAPQWLLESGAQLALLNSQSRENGQATVDYTERRYLKKIKSKEGALSIQRSETLFVRKDEAFEKEIFGH
ncbi:MAG: DUF814 domain-containing protein [Proteobacteria bacterium]|nr:DUF814 domain-containing protein [Pseudomonadota bacterium]